jgi:hypothetical protein
MAGHPVFLADQFARLFKKPADEGKMIRNVILTTIIMGLRWITIYLTSHFTTLNNALKISGA